MYVSIFSYVWIPESPRCLERAADSVYHLSHLFTDVTSCCDYSSFVYSKNVTIPVSTTHFQHFLSLFNFILLFNNLLILNIPVVTTPYKKLQQDEIKANNNNNDNNSNKINKS